MQDLEQAKAEALERQRATARGQRFQINVSMASCGIAAGAGATLEAIRRLIASDNISGVGIKQVGCLGLCSLEPIVQVQALDQPLVTYGKVTPEAARRIILEHIGKGLVVRQYVVENVFD
jgi:NADP-reducing hydrogenase subunit HndB